MDNRRRRRCPVVLTGGPAVKQCSAGPGLSDERVLSAETDTAFHGEYPGIKEGNGIYTCPNWLDLLSGPKPDTDLVRPKTQHRFV